LLHSGVEITDKNDAEITDRVISGIGDVMGKISTSDNANGEWFSAAGPKRGKLVGINKVELNLGSPGFAAQADVIYEKGVNTIIEDAGRIMYWGNRTMQIDKTKLLSKANISDLVIFISRTVRGIAKEIMFDPNDPISWNLLYRSVRPFIITLVDGRAIRGDNSTTKGEGKLWHWFGDQFASADLSDLQFNDKVEIDAGKYRARFAFVPIAAIEYIAIDIAPTDTITIKNVSQLVNPNG